MPLTDAKIRALKPRDSSYLIADAGGLCIEVAKSGSKLWRYRYRFNGRPRKIGLGAYPVVTLAEARSEHMLLKQRVQKGIDPGLERKKEKQQAAVASSNTFGVIAAQYIETKLVAEGKAESTISKAHWFIEKLDALANRPLTEIDQQEIFAILKKLEGQGKHETAKRCRAFASRVFRYAAARGIVDKDPAALLKGALITPKVTHHAAILDASTFGSLLRDIDQYDGAPITRLALQIAPHVMTRPGELRQATWDEIDFDKKVWTIDAARMKMREAHMVPLSSQVLVYLEELKQFSGPEGFLFPAFYTSKRPMSENTMNIAFRRMGYSRDEVTSHGLRTSASTLLNESGLWNPDAIERALAHKDRDTIRGTYNRGQYWDERVKMMAWWSDYLDELRLK